MVRGAEWRGWLQHDHDIIFDTVDSLHLGQRLHQDGVIADAVARQVLRSLEGCRQSGLLGHSGNLIMVGRDNLTIDTLNPGCHVAS